MKRNLKQWSTVFKGLGNPNRLHILKILTARKQVSVSALAEELGISLKNTSRNLAILSNLDLIQYQGKRDHVYYSINPNIDSDIQKILNLSV